MKITIKNAARLEKIKPTNKRRGDDKMTNLGQNTIIKNRMSKANNMHMTHSPYGSGQDLGGYKK